MKKLMFLLIFILLSSFTFSQTYIDSFTLKSPEVMAQGGSFTAIASGYNSLFTNPAGFEGKNSLTIVSLNPWVHMRPDRAVEIVEGMIAQGDFLDIVNIVNEQITTGGFGVGFSTGIAWTGSGLGLGIFGVADSYIFGNTLFGTEGIANVTISAVGGISLPFNIFGMKLVVGGDVRPMYHAYIPLQNNAIISLLSSLEGGESDPISILLSQDACVGLGLGLDVGAILELGHFSFGASIRDLFGTRFSFSEMSMQSIIDSIELTQTLPEGTEIEDVFLSPMVFSVGAAWHPDLGSLSFFIDPKIHVDLKDPIGVIRDKRSPWTLLHAGTEIKMLRFISLRGGLYQGYLTAGLGIDLLFIDINAAVFTVEKGSYIGDKPNSGFSLETSIRF